MSENYNSSRESIEKYFEPENLDLREVKKGSKILIQTKNHNYTFEVERPARGGEWARGKVKGGRFIDEDRPLAARIHGSTNLGSQDLDSNKIYKKKSLVFSILKDEIKGKNLPIDIDNTQSTWQTITTSTIQDFEVVPPGQEITPKEIT